MIPTSNHNVRFNVRAHLFVVYLLIPTSNHNCPGTYPVWYRLYIFWFLHQTTTGFPKHRNLSELYIFWFLHQTTTICLMLYLTAALYIFWFLHQTTTLLGWVQTQNSCISFDSYIKPQRKRSVCFNISVVYLLIPTSNHNMNNSEKKIFALYIFWFLHQTTTMPFHK